MEIIFEKSAAVISSFSLTVLRRHFILIMQEVAEAYRYFSFKIKTLKLQCDDFQIFQASLPLALIAPLLFQLQRYLLFQYAALLQCCTKPLLLCSKKKLQFMQMTLKWVWWSDKQSHFVSANVGGFVYSFTVNFVEVKGFANSLLEPMH